MDMQTKLKEQVGKLIQIRTETYVSNQQTLEKVYEENFIKMGGVNYVPQAANEIILVDKKTSSCKEVKVRTIYEEEPFTAFYMSRGSDYIELARALESGEEITPFLIPLNKLIGLQFV